MKTNTKLHKIAQNCWFSFRSQLCDSLVPKVGGHRGYGLRPCLKTSFALFCSKREILHCTALSIAMRYVHVGWLHCDLVKFSWVGQEM